MKFAVVLYYGNKDHTWGISSKIEVEIDRLEYQRLMDEGDGEDEYLSAALETLAGQRGNWSQELVFYGLYSFEVLEDEGDEDEEPPYSGGYGTRGYSEASGIWD